VSGGIGQSLFTSIDVWYNERVSKARLLRQRGLGALFSVAESLDGG